MTQCIANCCQEQAEGKMFYCANHLTLSEPEPWRSAAEDRMAQRDTNEPQTQAKLEEVTARAHRDEQENIGLRRDIERLKRELAEETLRPALPGAPSRLVANRRERTRYRKSLLERVVLGSNPSISTMRGCSSTVEHLFISVPITRLRTNPTPASPITIVGGAGVFVRATVSERG